MVCYERDIPINLLHMHFILAYRVYLQWLYPLIPLKVLEWSHNIEPNINPLFF